MSGGVQEGTNLVSFQVLKRIPLEKRPTNAQNRRLLKEPNLNSGTEHSEVFGGVSGQDVAKMWSDRKKKEKMRSTQINRRLKTRPCDISVSKLVRRARNRARL